MAKFIVYGDNNKVIAEIEADEVKFTPAGPIGSNSELQLLKNDKVIAEFCGIIGYKQEE